MLFRNSHLIPASVLVSEGAPLVGVSAVVQPKNQGKGIVHSVRSSIKTFSRKSRVHMKKVLGMIDRKAYKCGYFVTLTYPPELYPGLSASKCDLRLFIKFVKRMFPFMEYVWKMEYHKSGRVHYHLICFDVHDHRLLLRRGRSYWWSVITRRMSSSDYEHYRSTKARNYMVPIHVEKISGEKGLCLYIMKYVNKPVFCDGVEAPGKFWGKSNGLFRLFADYRLLIFRSKRSAHVLWRQLRKTVYTRFYKRYYRSLGQIKYVLLSDPSLVVRLCKLFDIEYRESRWKINLSGTA